MKYLKKLKSKIYGDKFFTKDFVDEKYRKNIGEFTYGHPIIVDWGEGATLKIGKFTSIAGGTTILLGGHHQYGWTTTYPFPSRKDIWPEAKAISDQSFSKGDVIIGNDVLLGHECLIMSGVTVGDGAVVGARAVVTKDILPYAIVAGNPAKVIRFRFDKKTISKLLKIKWWDWPEEKIRKNIHILCSPNYDKL